MALIFYYLMKYMIAQMQNFENLPLRSYFQIDLNGIYYSIIKGIKFLIVKIACLKERSMFAYIQKMIRISFKESEMDPSVKHSKFCCSYI